MGSDISRFTFDPSKHYSGVRQQQGRVNLDADWNEQVDIAAHRIETETVDVIGASGAPRDNAGFQIQAPGVWAPSTSFALGTRIFDSNGRIEIATAAGTSGATAPTWPTSLGATVTDGSSGLIWQLVASDLEISAGRIANRRPNAYVDFGAAGLGTVFAVMRIASIPARGSPQCLVSSTDWS